MKKNLYVRLMAIIVGITLAVFIVVRLYVIASFKDKLIRQVPKSAVDTAYSIVESIDKDSQLKHLPIDQAQSRIKEVIGNLRLEDGSYFWIHDLNLKMVLHPIKPAMNGTDISNYKSPKGFFIFAEMNEVIKKNDGRGWYNYLWTKPNETKDKEKTSYLKLYKPYGWVIGSGMYVEDVEASMKDFFFKIQLIIFILFGLALISGHLIAKRISEKLKKVAFDVDKTAKNFKDTAKQTQVSIQSLAEISIEQAAAIEETAASVDEIRAMAELNAKHSEAALGFSQDNKAMSMHGKEALSELVLAINDIEGSLKNMNKEIEGNNRKFEDIIQVISEINQKTKIINEIVFQTKLLSFNASVESARAGEHGKGFAVVAEEIGKLATMSGEASREINELISSSADRISKIVEESKKMLTVLNKETTSKVAKGQSTNNEFSRVFDSIILNIENMNSTITQMSFASKEQGQGIAQINLALGQLTDAGNVGVNSTENIKTQIEELFLSAGSLDSSVKILNKEIQG